MRCTLGRIVQLSNLKRFSVEQDHQICFKYVFSGDIFILEGCHSMAPFFCVSTCIFSSIACLAL